MALSPSKKYLKLLEDIAKKSDEHVNRRYHDSWNRLVEAVETLKEFKKERLNVKSK